MVVISGVKNMFWGVTIDAGKRYSQVVNQTFHLSMAALEPNSATSNEYVQVMVQHNSAEYLLCSLQQGKLLQQNLDLIFAVGEELSFSLVGKGVVHLTGYLLDDQQEDYDDFSDEEDSDAPQLVEIDDDSLTTGSKRKAVTLPGQSKKIKFSDTYNDDDDDDDDDDDEDFSEDDLTFDEDEDSDLDDEEDDDDEHDDDDEDEDDDDDEDEDDDDEEEEEEIPQVTQVQKKPAKVTPKMESTGSAKKDKQVKSAPPTPKTPASQVKKNEQKQNEKSPQIPSTPTNGESESAKKKKKKRKNKNKEGEKSMNESTASSPGKSAKEQTPKSAKKEKKENTQTPKIETPGKRKVVAGGTVVEDLKVGHGPEAQSGKMVSVYYVGTLSKTNQRFDSCTNGKPFRFRLKKGEVIKGWDNGVEGMRVGGKRKITVPANQGYGNQKQGPIPANSSLTFEVELKAVN